jgi:hypothetical protein
MTKAELQEDMAAWVAAAPTERERNARQQDGCLHWRHGN